MWEKTQNIADSETETAVELFTSLKKMTITSYQ